jgi:hypothetical protein
MEVSAQLHASAALLPDREPLVAIREEDGGAQRRSGYGGKEKNSQPLSGLEPPIIQPAEQRCTAELSRQP